MKTTLGSRVPDAHEIQDILDQIRDVAEGLTTYTGRPDADEEGRRSASFRAEGERVVTMVTQLATLQELAIPGVPVQAMTREMELARRLQPVADALAALLQAVDDTVLAAESVCWETATAYYDALHRMSASDPMLRAALRPVQDYFGGAGAVGSYIVPSA